MVGIDRVGAAVVAAVVLWVAPAAAETLFKIVTEKESYLVLLPLKRFETWLPAAEFCRIHRAFIVALSWINSFDTSNVYGPAQSLPIGELYRGHLQTQLTVISDPLTTRTTTQFA